MVLDFFGTTLTEDELAKRCGTTLLGTGRVELAQAATGLGLAAQLADHLARDDVQAQLSQGHPVIAWIDPSLLSRVIASRPQGNRHRERPLEFMDYVGS